MVVMKTISLMIQEATCRMRTPYIFGIIVDSEEYKRLPIQRLFKLSGKLAILIHIKVFVFRYTLFWLCIKSGQGWRWRRWKQRWQAHEIGQKDV